MVKMKRQVFDSLDHVTLVEVCIEPVLQRIRGKNPTVKKQVCMELTAGQGALLMFRVIHDHAIHSVEEFYLWFSDLLAHSDYWPEIKSGMRHLRADNMLRFLAETEDFFEARNRQEDASWRDVRPRDLEEDAELLTAVGRLHAMLQEIAPATLKRIGDYIRYNPGEFVRIEG